MSSLVEPKVRRDGLCLVCRMQRKTPSPLQKGVSASTYLSDPFCSATCARSYFGTSLSTATTARK